MTIWLKNGELVDSVNGVIKKRDIIIDRGRVERILPPGEFKDPGPRIEIIDVAGKVITPGLIDMHVHLREPGYEYKETILTGSRAGVAGGFTALACMPNTDPINDTRSITEYILKQAQKANLSRVYPIAAITMGQKGCTLTEFGDLKQAGAVGLSDDGHPVVNSEVMRRALEYASYYSLTVISHCEDLDLSANGVMHEGEISTRIGLAGIPAASEEVMVNRDITLAKLTGCPVHIAHVSTAGSVDAIRKAKETGIPVTAETTPHHFTLDHRAVIGFDTNTKINPPLRTREDIEAIKKGLKEDVIDVIASDHAPHSPIEKELEFDKAAFGIIGLETTLPLTLTLVREGSLDLAVAVNKLSFQPARILSISGGQIKEGRPADLSVIDLDHEYELKTEDIQSKSKNSPFIGKMMKGINILTMVGGRIVWKRDI